MSCRWVPSAQSKSRRSPPRRTSSADEGRGRGGGRIAEVAEDDVEVHRAIVAAACALPCCSAPVRIASCRRPSSRAHPCAPRFRPARRSPSIVPRAWRTSARSTAVATCPARARSYSAACSRGRHEFGVRARNSSGRRERRVSVLLGGHPVASAAHTGLPRAASATDHRARTPLDVEECDLCMAAAALGNGGVPARRRRLGAVRKPEDVPWASPRHPCVPCSCEGCEQGRVAA